MCTGEVWYRHQQKRCTAPTPTQRACFNSRKAFEAKWTCSKAWVEGRVRSSPMARDTPRPGKLPTPPFCTGNNEIYYRGPKLETCLGGGGGGCSPPVPSGARSFGYSTLCCIDQAQTPHKSGGVRGIRPRFWGGGGMGGGGGREVLEEEVGGGGGLAPKRLRAKNGPTKFSQS